MMTTPTTSCRIGAAALLTLGIVCSVAITAQTPAPAAQSTAAAPSGNAEAGQKLYLKVGCQRCHGYVGQGGGSAGPRLAPNPMPIAAFSRYIRAPRASMPVYTAQVLTDQDLADIHAFLRAQPGPAKVDSLLPPP